MPFFGVCGGHGLLCYCLCVMSLSYDSFKLVFFIIFKDNVFLLPFLSCPFPLLLSPPSLFTSPSLSLVWICLFWWNVPHSFFWCLLLTMFMLHILGKSALENVVFWAPHIRKLTMSVPFLLIITVIVGWGQSHHFFLLSSYAFFHCNC